MKKKKKKEIEIKINTKNLFTFLFIIFIILTILSNALCIYNQNKTQKYLNKQLEQIRTEINAEQDIIFVFDNDTIRNEGEEVTPSQKTIKHKKAIDTINQQINNLTQQRANHQIQKTESLEQDFIKKLRQVYNKSKDTKIKKLDTFIYTYQHYSKLAKKQYSTKLDYSYPSKEYIQTIPQLIQNDFVADCDDYALFFYVVAEQFNLPVVYVIGRGDGFGHAWIRVKINNQWMDFDSTNYNYGVNAVSHRYYKTTEVKIK